MEKINAFLDTVRNNPEAKERMKAMPAPKNDQEAAEGYVRIAKELGFDLTADEILAGLKGMEQKQKAQADKVALDAGDLDNVAGGANPGCDDTHSPGEWCWFSDSCSVIISYYDEQPQETEPADDLFGRATFHDGDESGRLFHDFDEY